MQPLASYMSINRRSVLWGITAPLTAATLQACANPPHKPSHKAQSRTQGSTSASNIFEAFDDRFYKLVDTTQSFETLGQGYGWSEGPTWDSQRQALYFTDVPGNIAYKWQAGAGVTEFLNPSGAQGLTGFREVGANGLLYNRFGKLLICNHGKRAVQIMDIDTKTRTTLVSNFEGQALNSPNDLIESANGDIYFTDPPYGLEGLNGSPLKELPHNGVYKLAKSGQVSLISDALTFPNGIALSPDEKTLYVAQSDPKAMHIYRCNLTQKNAPLELWIDLAPYADNTNPGLPDGMAVDIDGHIFATGPGGIFVISAQGVVLGRIKTGKASANCTFGEDGHSLFITNHDRLRKLRVTTRGLGWA